MSGAKRGRTSPALLWPALALMLTAYPLSAGENDGAPPRRIVIVGQSDSDARLAATREAIAFWNRTFSELTLREPFIETQALMVTPSLRSALEGYTRSVWRLAGKAANPYSHPLPPQPLKEFDADVVVFFSMQQFFSFAWPFAENTRHFVAISTDTVTPMRYPNVTRNVIAHEFGHVLGLRHNGYTPTLMCGPCETLVYRSARPVFFPLTPAEQARLRTLHTER